MNPLLLELGLVYSEKLAWQYLSAPFVTGSKMMYVSTSLLDGDPFHHGIYKDLIIRNILTSIGAAIIIIATVDL